MFTPSPEVHAYFDKQDQNHRRHVDDLRAHEKRWPSLGDPAEALLAGRRDEADERSLIAEMRERLAKRSRDNG